MSLANCLGKDMCLRTAERSERLSVFFPSPGVLWEMGSILELSWGSSTSHCQNGHSLLWSPRGRWILWRYHWGSTGRQEGKEMAASFHHHSPSQPFLGSHSCTAYSICPQPKSSLAPTTTPLELQYHCMYASCHATSPLGLLPLLGTGGTFWCPCAMHATEAGNLPALANATDKKKKKQVTPLDHSGNSK